MVSRPGSCTVKVVEESAAPASDADGALSSARLSPPARRVAVVGNCQSFGYAFARGKKIVGYRGDFRLAADNLGSAVNLQVEYFILASGGEILPSLDALRARLSALGK